MYTHLRIAILAAVRLLFWSISFFYRHPSLILLSLIPATFRFIQMWIDQTPIWMEVIVESARVVLFLLIIALMSQEKFKAVFTQPLWKRWNQSLKIELERNWPLTFTAQILIFILGLYWLMNSLIEWLLNPAFISAVMSLIGVETFNYEQVYTASLFFLKNMSVIPLSIVYILRMLGLGIHD